MIADSLHPAFILIFGALLLAVLPHRLRQVWLVALPVVSLIQFLGVEPSQSDYLGLSLAPVAMGKINFLFGILFHIAAFIAAIYSIHLRDRVQLVTGMMYAGGAIGVAVAGDFLTLFLFWELLAITSVFQVWAGRTKRSGASGIRYLLFQILSGLLLLAGAAVLYDASDPESLFIRNLDLADGLGPWLIFLGIGIKCAFPFLHTWLVDSYPESTPTGTVFLSAFTTKAAICILAQTFRGTEELIWIGSVMTLFPIFYAVLENDLRRVLAYSMINQIGFMVVGIGIGTDLAVNGAVTHAFNDVIFKGLLFMSMGAVLFRTGKIKCSEIGGLYKSMPLTTGFCVVGAASISAFPLLSGFVSKSMVLAAAAQEGNWVVWLILLFASAGVLHHAGIKIPFFAFFAHDSGIRCKEAPTNMLVAMGIAAVLCVFNGTFPFVFLYQLAPHPEILVTHAVTPDQWAPYTITHVITQFQLLIFAGLAFVWLRIKDIEPHELPSVNLDADWFYRKGGGVFYRAVDVFFNGLNARARKFFVDGLAAKVSRFFEAAPSHILSGVMVPIWLLAGHSREEIDQRIEILFIRSRRGAFPIGITACLAVLLLALLFLI